MTVKVEGLRDLEKQLLRLSAAAAKGVARRSAIKAMQPMADIATRLAPDDVVTPAPDLHTSIAVSTRQKGGRSKMEAFDGPTQVTVHMGPTKGGYPQAIYQEFGTVKMKAQPYMRPAWDMDKMAMLERLRKLLWIEVEKTIARAEKRAAKLAQRG